MTTAGAGPWQLVDQLRSWALATDWCQWLELAGSLGRGGGDELSDVDAGIGVNSGYPFPAALDEALLAVQAFAPVADHLIQPLGTQAEPADHLVIQYRDGRQLSLVVTLAHLRPGLPPGAQALFDRTDQLATPCRPGSLTASRAQQREWAFLGWWALSDVAKHATRRKVWRAMTALDEARSVTWKLHAAFLGVDYPMFGAISVENADLPAPHGIEASLPTGLDTTAILAAARALSCVLDPLTAHLTVAGIRQAALGRLTSEINTPSSRSGSDGVGLLAPGVEHLNAQRPEVSDVAGDDDKMVGERGGCDQDVSFGSWVKDVHSRRPPDDVQIDRQGSGGERRK